MFRLRVLAVSVLLLFSSPAPAMCPIPGNHITLLEWSKDGNSALLIAYFINAIDFIVVEGTSAKIHTFTFSETKPASNANTVSAKQCEQSMSTMNSLLEKDGMSKVPLVSKPCRKIRMLSTEDLGDLGSAKLGLKALKADKYTAEYESEAVSPGGFLKFNFKGNYICGGDHVILYRREAKGYSEFHRW